MCWDFILLLFLIINLWYVPISISFDTFEFKKDLSIMLFFEIFPFLIFLADIFLNLNTAFYSKGIIIYEKEEILKNYFHNKFFIDIITLFPFYITTILKVAKLLELFYLLRIFKLITLLKKMEEYLQLSDKFQYFIRLLKLFFYILYIAHVCGCVWHFTAVYEINHLNSNQTWLNFSNLIEAKWHARYINCLYYSVLTMITVGHITTDSNLEKSVSIFLVLVLSLVFAYSINTIGLIFQDMNKIDTDIKYLNFLLLFIMNIKKIMF